MELISKISKGSRMDQIYLPKNRSGFVIGSYVIIKPIETKNIIEKPYFYNIKSIEPIKVDIASKIFDIVDKIVDEYDNVIITGSFLDPGFIFNDIDIILIKNNAANTKHIEAMIKEDIGIKTHIISLSNKTFAKGLSTDPLYRMMLSRCIAKKRIIYKQRTYQIMNYKLLDLHLLKSRLLIDNFDVLNGNEKYYLVRNMIAILIYIQNKKITKEIVDNEIERIFDVKIEEIKQNKLNKIEFSRRYKATYQKLFKKIMDSIKNGSEQK